MLAKSITVLLVLIGLINFAPVLGVLSVERLHSLYGITLVDNNIVLLMRHRALLFGIVGCFVIYSAFMPSLQPVAMLMAAVSMLGFILLAQQGAAYNEFINKIIKVDWVGLALFLVAVALYVVKRAQS